MMKHTYKQRREMLIKSNQKRTWEERRSKNKDDFPYLACKETDILALTLEAHKIEIVLIIVLITILAILQVLWVPAVIERPLSSFENVTMLVINVFIIFGIIYKRVTSDNFFYVPDLKPLFVFPKSFKESALDGYPLRPSNGLWWTYSWKSRSYRLIYELCCEQELSDVSIEDMEALDRIWVFVQGKENWVSEYEIKPMTIKQARQEHGVDEMYAAYKRGVPIDDICI